MNNALHSFSEPKVTSSNFFSKHESQTQIVLICFHEHLKVLEKGL